MLPVMVCVCVCVCYARVLCLHRFGTFACSVGKELNLASCGYGDKFFEAFGERLSEMGASLEVCSCLGGRGLTWEGECANAVYVRVCDGLASAASRRRELDRAISPN